MKTILAIVLAGTLTGAYTTAVSAQEPARGDEVSGRSAATMPSVEDRQIEKSEKSRSISHEKNGNASEFDPQNPGRNKGP